MWSKIAMVGALLASGCVGEEEQLAETEQAVKPNPGDSTGCPPWACGSNSPQIDFNAFHELNELNVANVQGFRISNFQKWISGTWQSFRPDVMNGSLVARNPTTNAIVYSGSSLVGAIFTVNNDRTGGLYYLTVAHMARTTMWAKIAGRTTVTPTYELTWSTVFADTTGGNKLCGVDTDATGVGDFYAVLFDDDRIDADAIRVTGETANWFNIGCAGHALAKQHLTGNTKAGAAIIGATAPTINNRTANLKMLSADYCGGGDPFTVAGTPLRWKDSLGRVDTTMTSTHIEARWNETGAICLNVPRVDYSPTPLGTATFPGHVEPLLVPAAGWCTGLSGTRIRPPACTNANLADFQGAYLISVNP